MKLIGISGKAGSGKDTLKEIIQTELASRGLRVASLSFAGPLKDALVLWFGWDRQRLDSDFPYKEGGLGNPPGKPDDVDPICVMLGMTRREIMQKFGTECMRDGLDQNFWIKLAEYRIKTGMYPGDVFIVSDARFENELNWIEQNSGYTVKIDRVTAEKGEDRDQKVWEFLNGTITGSTLTDKVGHASESSFEKWASYTTKIVNVVDKNLSPEEGLENFRKFVLNTVMPGVWEMIDRESFRFSQQTEHAMAVMSPEAITALSEMRVDGNSARQLWDMIDATKVT